MVNFPILADRDSDSQEQDVSLIHVLKADKAQGEWNAKLSQDISNLRQQVHVAFASVASQVKKLKTEIPIQMEIWGE